MADLDEKTSAGATKIVGSDANSNETNYAAVDALGNVAVAVMAPALNYYSCQVSLRQSAASGANTTVWAMRNTGAKTVYIERIFLQMSFDAGTPLIRTVLRYKLQRFSSATPTGGTALNPTKMDNNNPASSVGDIRTTDTGLSTTGVAFETGVIATIGCPAVSGSTTNYVREGISIKLAPGEGLAIRLEQAAVVGQDLSGEIVWSER